MRQNNFEWNKVVKNDLIFNYELKEKVPS